QKKANEIMNKTNKEISKYQEDYNSTTNPEAKYELIDYIQDLKQVLYTQKIKFQIIMLQDNKAKVPLSISVVEKSFKAIQSYNKLVTILNYDFSVSLQQKLTSSVYLIINLSDTNDILCKGQLSIYICSQYKIGTSSVIYMNDLYSLMNNSSFDDMLKVDNKIRPI
ncbi:6407_t:CDS:2, partial [Scutellospora calospora]